MELSAQFNARPVPVHFGGFGLVGPVAGAACLMFGCSRAVTSCKLKALIFAAPKEIIFKLSQRSVQLHLE